jgi:hypothetical protein
MMNKSLRGGAPESSHKTLYGFQRLGTDRTRRASSKKEPPFPAAFEVDNREASNRVDRSHSVSKEDGSSHNRESLTDRKRAILFRNRLPYGSLAEREASSCPATVPGIHVLGLG